jgi:hypothetical protein
VEFSQTVVPPVIALGCAGAPGFTTIGKVCAVLLPHPLFAVTLIFPPLAPTVAVMLFVVEFPVQPFGKVHVYEVAPETAATL